MKLAIFINMSVTGRVNPIIFEGRLVIPGPRVENILSVWRSIQISYKLTNVSEQKKWNWFFRI